MIKKLINYTLVLLLIAGLSVGGFRYYQHEKAHPNTDDAYIQAHITYIAPRINGQVKKINVTNMQHVHKGQLLFSIDPKPMQIALNKAQADLANTKQQVEAAKAEVQTAKSLVAQRQAELTDIRAQYQRTETLVKEKLYAAQQGDTVTRQLKVANSALASAQSQLAEASAKLGNLGDANASIRAAKAAVTQAQLNVTYTQVYAPADGYLVNFKLNPGDSVTAYQQQFSLVEDHQWWAQANFKETDLSRIKAGQRATITVDMYPHHHFTGIVSKISSGSGSSFSLLPPENASGNWVKVTQRFPVKVQLTHLDKHFPMRLGASCTVTINTTKHS